jgi:predicted phosphoribosyltransferase
MLSARRWQARRAETGDYRLAEVLLVDDGVEMTGFDPVSAL